MRIFAVLAVFGRNPSILTGAQPGWDPAMVRVTWYPMVEWIYVGASVYMSVDVMDLYHRNDHQR